MLQEFFPILLIVGAQLGVGNGQTLNVIRSRQMMTTTTPLGILLAIDVLANQAPFVYSV